MTDFAEDRHWACGSVTEVLTERHHINLVFSKGIKDEVKQQKTTSGKKSEMSKSSNSGMKDNFSLQQNTLFQRKPKRDSHQTCQSFHSELSSLKDILLMEGRCRPSSTMGYRTPRCALFLLEKHLRTQMVKFCLSSLEYSVPYEGFAEVAEENKRGAKGILSNFSIHVWPSRLQ